MKKSTATTLTKKPHDGDAACPPSWVKVFALNKSVSERETKNSEEWSERTHAAAAPVNTTFSQAWCQFSSCQEKRLRKYKEHFFYYAHMYLPYAAFYT